MKLKESMKTHEGEYLIAETTRSITVSNLDAALGEREVEPHVLGDDGYGRRCIHLYTTGWPHHLVTHIESGTFPGPSTRKT
jgi:hypothetical protein